MANVKIAQIVKEAVDSFGNKLFSTRHIIDKVRAVSPNAKYMTIHTAIRRIPHLVACGYNDIGINMYRVDKTLDPDSLKRKTQKEIKEQKVANARHARSVLEVKKKGQAVKNLIDPKPVLAKQEETAQSESEPIPAYRTPAQPVQGDKVMSESAFGKAVIEYIQRLEKDIADKSATITDLKNEIKLMSASYHQERKAMNQKIRDLEQSFQEIPTRGFDVSKIVKLRKQGGNGADASIS